jgi:prepilin-type N-terminal cleavage/methylation domain-containing protein
MKHMKSAFTLIELLVVISIIALLIALLLPALARARFAAETIECTSRIRHMAVSVNLYTADHRGFFPHMSAYGYNYGSWIPQIAPYTGAVGTTSATNFRHTAYKAMQCNTRVSGVWTYGYPYWFYSMPWSLQFRPALMAAGQPGWGGGAEVPQRADDLKQHSKLGVFVDGGAYWTAIHPPHIDSYGIFGHPSPGIAEPNHQGRGIGHAYYDGHAGFFHIDPKSYSPSTVRPPWFLKSFWQVKGSWGFDNGYAG